MIAKRANQPTGSCGPRNPSPTGFVILGKQEENPCPIHPRSIVPGFNDQILDIAPRWPGEDEPIRGEIGFI